MPYTVVDPSSMEPRADIPGDHRFLEDAAELSSLSMQYVTAAPGESFVPYHYHEEQDEVFFVLSGELHVRTPDREYSVPEGTFFVAPPSNPLQPYNPATADEPVKALIINAPMTDDYQPYEPTDGANHSH